MDRSSKIALAGVAVALLVLGGGALRAKRFEEREAELVKECSAVATTAKSANPFDQFDDAASKAGLPALPAGYMLDPLICTSDDLIRIGGNEGIQGKVVDAHWATAAARETPTFVASLIAGLAIIPWLWYFLLRRISELQSAVSGNAPRG